jgi:superfamily II DNA or RNA helicase/HKD family nuclease
MYLTPFFSFCGHFLRQAVEPCDSTWPTCSMTNPTPDNVVSNQHGCHRMLDVVRTALQTATEIAISVSFLRYSGLGLVADDLKQFGARGGRIRFLTSTYMGITQPEALRALHSFEGVQCRVHVAGHGAGPATGFHTKIYVFSGVTEECWVGSSNFSKGGLATNIEANLRHLGSAEFESVGELFNQLWQRTDVVAMDNRFADAYAQSLPTSKPWSGQTSNLLDALSRMTALDEPSNMAPTNYPFDREGTLLRIESEEMQTLPVPNAAQLEALERLASLRDSGEIRAAVIAAPGVGKTFLAAFDARAAGAQSILFLSHRLEHLTQAERTFRRVFGTNKSYGQLFDGHDGSTAEFVFATIGSASGSAALGERKFDYIVVDEFHHAAAPSYQKLLATLRPKFLLGLTATPERQDGHDVLRTCDYNVAYEVRLPEAINRGWLLPFHYFGVADDAVDYDAIPWRSGKFDPTALEHALMVQNRVDAVLQHCQERGFDGPRRATIGFCAGVRHAHFMAGEFKARGLDAEAITGSVGIQEREALYARFQDPLDTLEWLFVADVLNEGVDIPAINSIIFLRPTESATIFIQQLGRGLRLSPGCEVLTAIDLVGHHRAAWLTVEALGDRDAPIGPSTILALDLTPPRSCEIILDTKTLEILEKIRQRAIPKKQLCLDAYRQIQDEAGVARPYPADLLNIESAPNMAEFRAAFKSWVDVRRAADDANEWERRLQATHPSYKLLAAAERDWQAQRVWPYAALWGMCAAPDNPEAGYNDFFERFPRWKAEFKPLGDSKVLTTLTKKLDHLFDGKRLVPASLVGIPRHELLQEIEGRLQYVLEKDFRQRHGGILRSPSDLLLHRRYGRPEIVNYFGSQYDPSKHNFGVLKFGREAEHVVIITKLDTSGAISNFHYTNWFADVSTFLWTSQNRQSQHDASGMLILEHRKAGRHVHLFVQSASHEKAIYCGELDAYAVKGDLPMTVWFKMRQPLSSAVLAELVSSTATFVLPIEEEFRVILAP